MATPPAPGAGTPGAQSGGTLKRDKSGGWKGTLSRRNKKSEKEEQLKAAVNTHGPYPRERQLNEVNQLEQEGKHAIDDPTSPAKKSMSPDSYQLGHSKPDLLVVGTIAGTADLLEEGEERYMVSPNSLEDAKVKDLCEILLDWINDELSDMRIVVKNIAEDLFDGHILAIFVEKLSAVDMGPLTEVTQSVSAQKQKLGQLLDKINEITGSAGEKWNKDLIFAKHLPAILHLLVRLARHYECPYKLPENVTMNVVVVQKKDGILRSKTVPEDITSDLGKKDSKQERDAFDTLFDHAPEKLSVVKKSLQGFVNKHLSKLNLEVTSLDTQFHDGVYFILLIGLLEGYFVPLHLFHLTPKSFEQKVHNVEFALELVKDAGLGTPKAKAEEIVNHDLKSTLRVLYALFTKYKTL